MSTFKITGTITDADGSKVDFTAIDTPDYNKVVAMSGMGSVGALSTIPAPISGQYVNAEVNSFASTIIPAPSVPWLNAMDTLVTTLKSASIWSTFDLFYILAAPTSVAASYNAVNVATGRLTQNGAINYVANGYAASDGTTGWFSTTFSVNSGHAVNGNAEFGYFCLNDDSSDNISVFQSSGSKHYLGLTASATAINNMTCGLNTSTSASFSSLWGSTVGHFVLQQGDTNSTLEAFLDGSSLGTSVQTTSADSGTVQLFRSGASFTNRQAAFVHYGSKLNSSQHLTLSKALYTFLAAIGVRPLAGQLGLSTGPTNLAPYKHCATGNGNNLTMPVSPSFPAGTLQCHASAYPYAAIKINDPNYHSLVRLEVHPGDNAPFDSAGITRVQWNTGAGIDLFSFQTTVDFAYSFYIEPGSVLDTNNFDDLNDCHDQTTSVNCGPTHGFDPALPNSPYRFYVWGLVNHTTYVNVFPIVTSISIAAGQWHHVRTTWRCDNSPNGFAQSWVNGVQILNYTGGAWGSGSAGAPYWQQVALYRGNSDANPFALWYANLEFDTSGSQPYSSRINNPLACPPLV